MITILMMSAKMVTLGRLKRKVFINNVHDVTKTFYHVIQLIL